MRKVALTLAATTLFASGASAQYSGVPPESAERSIAATIDKHADTHLTGAESAVVKQAVRNFWSNCGPTTSADSLWSWLDKCAVKPSRDLWLRLSQQNAALFGGGGASGGWDARWEQAGVDKCADFRFEIIPGVGARISSLPLVGGGALPHSPGSTPTPKVFAKDVRYADGSMVQTTALNPMAIALWAAHQKSVQNVNPAQWYGAWKATPYAPSNRITYQLQSDFYQLPNDSNWYLMPPFSQAADLTTYNEQGYPAQYGYKSCPTGGFGSTGFDFYLKSSQCIWYKKNFDLGATGYAYSPMVGLTFQQLATWPDADTAVYYGCDIEPGAISDIAEEVIEEVCEQNPGSPACDLPPDPVPQNCGSNGPNLGGTVSATRVLDCPETPQQPDDPQPDPTTDPPGEGGGDGAPDGWYDQPPGGDVNIPDFGLEMPDWWPNLPNLDFASATCPTYQLDLNGFFGQAFVVDSHCPIIADFRSTIAAIMLVCWTMAAAVIVMRA